MSGLVTILLVTYPISVLIGHWVVLANGGEKRWYNFWLTGMAQLTTTAVMVMILLRLMTDIPIGRYIIFMPMWWVLWWAHLRVSYGMRWDQALMVVPLTGIVSIVGGYIMGGVLPWILFNLLAAIYWQPYPLDSRGIKRHCQRQRRLVQLLRRRM